MCSWSNRVLALGMEIEFPMEYGTANTWWQTTSGKRTDCKIFGILCYEMRYQQHLFEVMWSLGGSALAAFYLNHKGAFRDSGSPGGLVRSEQRYCFEVKYQACPSPCLICNWTSTERVPLAHHSLAPTAQVRYRKPGMLMWRGEKTKRNGLDGVLQFPAALGANPPSGIVLSNANIEFLLLVYPHWNAEGILRFSFSSSFSRAFSGVGSFCYSAVDVK